MLNKSLLVEMTGKDVVNAHNSAVKYGFLQLPLLEYIDAIDTPEAVTVVVAPVSGMIDINELYVIKTEWGADTINVFTGDSGSIELVFKRIKPKAL